MKPATNSLSEIFQAPIRLVVPIYQRPYVWDKERHWQPLWEDIEAVLDRHLEGEEEPFRHFLGAVVLDQEDTPLGEVTRRLIIDGQQRLTTLQLLFAAAVRNAEADGADQQAKRLATLIENDEDLATGDDRFKVWPTNSDQAAFREVMTLRGESLQAPKNAIHDAHDYFRGAMKTWLTAENPGGADLERRHKAIWVALSSLLQVVSINLESGDNAQVIFETLNARGTPLLAMDLVKNVLFYRAQREHADVDLLNQTVWEPELGQDYWRETVRQGRLNRPRAELFLMHWLAMKLGRIIPATELFAEFRAHILGAHETGSGEELIAELCSDAAVLRGFDTQPAGTVEEQFFRHLDALDTTTVIPVALLLYRSQIVSEAQRETGLRVLESWLVRRMLCGLTAQAYSRLMADLLKALRSDLEHADEVIVGFLQASTAGSAVWPTDEMVISFLTTRYVYGYISQKRITMVLSAIEMQLRRDNKTEDIFTLPKNLTVEHVMPQTWAEHWPVADGQDPEEREVRINRLGNLTLTSGPLNSSLSNDPWQKKAPALVQHSLLVLNQRLAASDCWDEASIDQRGEALAQQICELWPGPGSTTWTLASQRLAATADAPTVARPPAVVPAPSVTVDALPPGATVSTVAEPEAAGPPSPASPRAKTSNDGRDFTRFHIVVGRAELPHENKRSSMRVLVTALIGRGVPAVAIGERLGGHFKSVAGELEDFVPAFLERYPTFDPAWWYTEHPFRQDGRTWLLDKAWGTETESTLKDLTESFPEAGVTFRRAGVGGLPSATASPSPSLRFDRHEPWRRVDLIEGFVAQWPEGEEPFGPLVVYETNSSDGMVRLAIGSPLNRQQTYGRERGWVSVWHIRNGQPGRQLANFLEADDFAMTGERVALINGKEGRPKLNFSAGEESSLPDAYQGLRIEVQRDRIAGPYARNKLVVVATDHDMAAMLDHGLAQLYLRS